MSYRGVHQLINLRKRETVIWACLIVVCEVYKDSPVPICLFNQYHISYPFWITNLSDETSFKELVNLGIDRYIPFCIKISLFLFYRSETRVNVQVVDNYFRVSARHVLM